MTAGIGTGIWALLPGPSAAWAAAAPAGQAGGGLMGMVFPLVLFMVIFYFLIIRPQKKKQKQHEAMLASISRGDKVVTAGGLFGTVRDILDDSLMLEVAEGVKIRVMKGSVSHKRTLDETGRPKKNGKDSGKEKGKEALPEAEKAPLPVESLPEEPTDSTGTEQK